MREGSFYFYYFYFQSPKKKKKIQNLLKDKILYVDVVWAKKKGEIFVSMVEVEGWIIYVRFILENIFYLLNKRIIYLKKHKIVNNLYSKRDIHCKNLLRIHFTLLYNRNSRVYKSYCRCIRVLVLVLNT